ncbi:Protein canopy-1 [Characodon lateralis]|uniref:Protein canopy-1 n=1 Tax=Characodon lateralis TaxID=208331 RepID=A0ABU7EVF3_9TELE|nr:Protein canopy-1 [Characodon lateralis]
MRCSTIAFSPAGTETRFPRNRGAHHSGKEINTRRSRPPLSLSDVLQLPPLLLYSLLQRKRHQVPFARSETHLSELLDGVCNSMNDYALYVDPETHHKQYRRFAPRSSGSSENFPDFKNFQFDGPEASNNLKFACETLVEELEDDIISLLGQDEGNVQEELCNRVSDYCEDDSQPNDEL